jgi:pyrroloquinoline quinone (PQQ) biosynthesis protein C
MLSSGIVCQLQSDAFWREFSQDMSKVIRWMPHLTTQLSWGCRTSRFLPVLRADNAATQARGICLELWPLIEALPANISHVCKIIPAEMQSAKELFSDLADEGRVYQGLFLRQCELVGIPFETLQNNPPSSAAIHVKTVVAQYCQSGNWENGVLAIATAELACTAFCRVALELFEAYFHKHADRYKEQLAAGGMEWIRLHARPKTRNALLLLRTLAELPSSGQSEMPEAVQEALFALLAAWQCPLEALVSTTNGAQAEAVGSAFVA